MLHNSIKKGADAVKDFITELMRYGFSRSFSEKVYNALLAESEEMLESYIHTAELLYDEEDING